MSRASTKTTLRHWDRTFGWRNSRPGLIGSQSVLILDLLTLKPMNEILCIFIILPFLLGFLHRSILEDLKLSVFLLIHDCQRGYLLGHLIDLLFSIGTDLLLIVFKPVSPLLVFVANFLYLCHFLYVLFICRFE